MLLRRRLLELAGVQVPEAPVLEPLLLEALLLEPLLLEAPGA